MRLGTFLAVIVASVVAASGALGLSCGDPVHDAEVAALGPEAPGIPRGPTHRAGQPCLTCHGGLGPGNPTFVTAGTVYIASFGSDAGALVDGSVTLQDDSTNPPFTATTNRVGNFYVTAGDWNPVFPIGGMPDAAAGPPHTITVGPPPPCDAGTPAGQCSPPQTMATAIGRGGVYASCAYCHFDPPGPTTPGHVYQNQ
jgi:hypothetical protein